MPPLRRPATGGWRDLSPEEIRDRASDDPRQLRHLEKARVREPPFEVRNVSSIQPRQFGQARLAQPGFEARLFQTAGKNRLFRGHRPLFSR